MGCLGRGADGFFSAPLLPRPDMTPEQIAELIRQDKKLEAIRALKEETGVDLATARDAVERIAHSLDNAGFAGVAAPEAAPVAPPAGMTDDVIDLARSGNTIAAIKLYRDRTGSTLIEARDAVLQAAGLPAAPASAPVRAVVVAVLGLLILMAGIAAALIFVG